jgi:hypothetical protein
MARREAVCLYCTVGLLNQRTLTLPVMGLAVMCHTLSESLQLMGKRIVVCVDGISLQGQGCHLGHRGTV